MKILVTAGSTRVMIDKVRAISNIFGGRTGTKLALDLGLKGNNVTLLTSSPNLFKMMEAEISKGYDYRKNVVLVVYKTYEDLAETLEREVKIGQYDVIIHSSAVSDYEVEGVYYLDSEGNRVRVDNSSKIPSGMKMFIELQPTEKLIDKIREPWGFTGKLIKFKLQADMSEKDLISIAVKSRQISHSDFIVANCLEWMLQDDQVLLIDRDDVVERVNRVDLGKLLYRRLK